MTTTMRAALVREIGADFELVSATLDDLQPDEVLVRLVATGMCGTDVHVQHGTIPFPLPGVLGHEGAGIVEAVGAQVVRVQPGDKVLLTFTSCGVCRNCLLGHPAYCVEFLPRNLLGGRRTDGSSTVAVDGGDVNAHFFAQSSFAEYAIAEERSVAVVSPDADLAALAPLGCGVQTGAGAVLNILRPDPGTSLAVFGVGAVGLSAVMAAALTPATTVVAVDVVASRLDLARELGATHTIDARDPDVLEQLLALTGGIGFDHAIDATGSISALRTAIHSLAPLGTAAAIGAPPAGSTVDVDVNHLLNGRRLIGVTEGDSQPRLFLRALVDLIGQGRFPLERLITPYRFEDIDTAAADIASGAVLKPVLTFD